ncbi:MAG: hypothetical protein HOF69_01580 [Campylobacteraceae bacterium]|jgi:subtilase family serine protease|nr:hypothetical protein [Campylobacteraceae bacterium]MBT3881933.1 hypothetical protein [Campylobacteraceae bacterium]
MKYKILLNLLAISTFMSAVDTIPMPPMIPSLDTKSNNISNKKSTIPKSCELIPPMVIFLPPPMQDELSKCKNELNKPKKEFVEKQLTKLFKKKVSVNKIEIVKKFNQLYKVTYNDADVILVNKTVDGFIEQ